MEKIAEKKREATRQFSAAEKCRAVLSVWTERRKPSEVCKELSVNWMILSTWQNRALEGMLQALEPRVALEKGPALSRRLQSLLEKRTRVLLSQPTALEARLERLQKRNLATKKDETSVPPKEKKE
jgi:transposase-like protein